MARESTIALNFMLEDTRSSTTIALGTPGITKSTTATAWTELTTTAAPPASVVVGEGVFITGTGWASLDNKLHIVQTINATSFTISTNTFKETTAAPPFADVDVYASTWTHACLVDFTPNPATPGEIDATTMCDTQRVTLPGLSAAGTATFNGVFDLSDPAFRAFETAAEDAVPRYLVATSRQGQVAVFHGVISMFSIGALTVEGLMTITGSMTLDAKPTYNVAVAA